jgi:murein DD-endopeptidase MepM/ murein hydrolase activator NlpD
MPPEVVREVMTLHKLYEGEYKITSPFGPRELPNGDKRPHKGIDCVGIGNKNIIAPTNGKIVSSQIITNKSSPSWEWGNYVKMDDLNGYHLFFCHLGSRAVKTGQLIEKYARIGVEGYTGYVYPQNSNGSHLHFEVRRKSDGVSIDPMEYFKILAEWEAKHLAELRLKVQSTFGFDDGTMKFFDGHPYPGSLFSKMLKK